MMAKVLWGVLLLFFSLMANAIGTNKAQTMDVDAKSSEITIALPSNPTTGYEWSIVSYDGKILNLISSEYVAPKTKLVGAGGNRVFTFSVIRDKSCCTKDTHVIFQYARSWDTKDNASSKDVTIHFVNNKPQ